MRITIDLPEEIYRKAQSTANRRGVTLSDLVSEALAREIGMEYASPTKRKRIQFPLTRSKSPRSLNLTNEDIQRIEDEEEERRHGFCD